MAQIPESANISDDERDTELILSANLSEVDAAVFDGQAAAVAVVTELHELVLQRFVLKVVADAGDEVKAFARFAAVADQRANLVGKRLLEVGDGHRRRIVIQAKEGSGDEEFPIGFYFQERADGDKPLDLRVVLKNLLEIVRAARSDLEIAEDGRPVARAESERGDGIEGLEDVALAVNDGAAKGGIKVVFLDDAPGNELLRLAVSVFAEQPLGDAIFEFAGVGESGIGIEMDEVGKAIDAGNVAVGEGGFDGVLVAVARLVFFQGGAVEEAFERRRTKLHGEFAGVAFDGSDADVSGRVE